MLGMRFHFRFFLWFFFFPLIVGYARLMQNTCYHCCCSLNASVSLYMCVCALICTIYCIKSPHTYITASDNIYGIMLLCEFKDFETLSSISFFFFVVFVCFHVYLWLWLCLSLFVVWLYRQFHSNRFRCRFYFFVWYFFCQRACVWYSINAYCAIA